MHSKKWSEYLLEFFMLFLAVFLGFVAENVREYFSDKEKGKEYIASLVEELKYDTAQYSKIVHKIELVRPYLDSLYINIKEAGKFNYALNGKWNCILNAVFDGYKPSMPTIQQLKSSGNLRLIESKVVNKILRYETIVDIGVETANTQIWDARKKVYAFEDRFCDYKNLLHWQHSTNIEDAINNIDYSIFEMKLLEKDTLKLNEFANSLMNYKITGLASTYRMKDAKQSAFELIQLINKEYHLENQ